MIKAFLDLRRAGYAFDNAVDTLQEDIGASLCIRCGTCCKCNTPQCMTIEAINTVSVATGEGKLRKLVSLCEGWLTERDPGLKVYEGKPLGFIKPEITAEWRYVSRNPCPFLGPSNMCALYSTRPLSCRAYGVTRDMTDVCTRPPGRGETMTQRRIVTGLPIKAFLNRFKARCMEENKTWVTYGHLPTLIYRAAEEKKFKALVDDNRIPSAKLVGIEFDTSLMWQPQVDALQRGVYPDLVAAMN